MVRFLEREALGWTVTLTVDGRLEWHPAAEILRIPDPQMRDLEVVL